jgi:hypothetical protein
MQIIILNNYLNLKIMQFLIDIIIQIRRSGKNILIELFDIYMYYIAIFV